MAASVSAYSTEAVDVDADSRPGSSAVAPAGGSAAAPPINPTADVEAPMMVYGISIQDYAQARLTKRVLNISILMGLMVRSRESHKAHLLSLLFVALRPFVIRWRAGDRRSHLPDAVTQAIVFFVWGLLAVDSEVSPHPICSFLSCGNKNTNNRATHVWPTLALAPLRLLGFKSESGEA